jgi:hypothetical protein
MRTDPIIEELHTFRQEYASRFNNSIDAIVEDLRQQQNAGKHRIVSFVGQAIPQDISNAWLEESERRYAELQKHGISEPAHDVMLTLHKELL